MVKVMSFSRYEGFISQLTLYIRMNTGMLFGFATPEWSNRLAENHEDYASCHISDTFISMSFCVSGTIPSIHWQFL
jgi:hypothetical protein